MREFLEIFLAFAVPLTLSIISNFVDGLATTNIDECDRAGRGGRYAPCLDQAVVSMPIGYSNAAMQSVSFRSTAMLKNNILIIGALRL